MEWSVIFEPDTLALYAEGAVTTFQLLALSLAAGGVLALAFALNHTDFAQASTVNRVLLNFPLMIALNLLAIKQLLVQAKSELSGVYRALIFAFVVNIIQLGCRFTLLILHKFELLVPSQAALIHSLGYYGLTTFAFLTLGSCLYLVYKKSSIEMRDNMERDPLTIYLLLDHQTRD